ncbi:PLASMODESMATA CALLOSE-BINDING PROTEIN 1-like [Bidens hawaiensis]|uniref:PLASMODESMATA CALLOSE-BINDING PROTEIN 1-like n=1 Tax=Bidens hawaiensis TaxID=980011 RepID=UPI00404B231D
MAPAALLLSLLVFSMATHSSATWCVCKKGGDDKVLQQAIDYACGNGADCAPTHQGGKCFNPDTITDHCNYAVNSYFQNKGQAPGSCDFKGAATVVSADPSSNGCTFPTSASGTGTASPRSPTNINGGIAGGAGGALGPSASDDVSHGGVRLHKQSTIFGFLAIVGAGVAMMLT